MANGARKVLAERITQNLIVTKYGHSDPKLSEFNILEAGHPLPDQSSLNAGQQLLMLLNTLPEKSNILFLISGGASSLVEVLPGGVSINDLENLNAWLLHSGWSITEINTLRKRVSCIKGGRLARHVLGHKSTVLLMSDVQNDDPAVIGSGMLFASDLISSLARDKELPDFIQQILHHAPAMPSADDPCFESIESAIIANLTIAKNAARQAATQLGYHVVVHSTYLQGDAIARGKEIAEVLKKQPDKLHIWGGEVTVVLPPKPGKGGRCQSMALSAAIALRDENDWCLLAAGTDGGDGVMDAAGVYIDNHTLENARRVLGAEVDPETFLQNADAGSLFEASGNLLNTGPTGTNVCDLVLAYLKS